ncbi:HdeD family acid-resistance protein [Gordonia neofelifaecis]|uniref:Integral membrane protein n=1 Tax=Gordonia neofelifaecis NRRL B-59395 TaxID=644548 RepID=F1YE42_9ACTN|nr:HdeD family acid-resistance protein [Gordonia neofelifaecis]EGD57132.1 hypothetical protein SCNU_02120 [Gordonia neofelifaecis NRRL B-59395]
MVINDPLDEAARDAVKELASRTWQSLLGIGIASAILGIIVLIWPGATLLVVSILFGIYLLISGIFQIAATFGVRESHGWWRVLSFVTGALSILLAFVAFRNIESAVILLAIWVGISWIFRGVAELSVFMDSASGLPGRGWGIFLAIVTVVAGGILIIWPISSVATLTVVAGIMLVVVGVVEIIEAFALRSKVNAV